MNSTTFIGRVGERGASVATSTGKSYQIVTFSLVDKRTFPSGKTYTDFCMVDWFGKQAVDAMGSLKPGALCVAIGEISLMKREGKDPLLKLRATSCSFPVESETPPVAPVAPVAPAPRPKPAEPAQTTHSFHDELGEDNDVPF